MPDNPTMPSWISSVLLAAATSLFIGYFITPRLEARKPHIDARINRVRARYETRDEFSKRIVIIFSVSARLQATVVTPSLVEARPAFAEKMNAERQRWIDQLDEATRYLVDNLEGFAFGRATDRIRLIVADFIIHARTVVLSERPVEQQVEHLLALTTPIYEVFLVVPRWRATTWNRHFDAFERAVAAIQEENDAA
ncbi:hypothetical protein [Streptomyces sp. NPDC055134]